jgi:hypothetical protein
VAVVKTRKKSLKPKEAAEQRKLAALRAALKEGERSGIAENYSLDAMLAELGLPPASDELEGRLDAVHSGRDRGVPVAEAHAAIRAERARKGNADLSEEWKVEIARRLREEPRGEALTFDEMRARVDAMIVEADARDGLPPDDDR